MFMRTFVSSLFSLSLSCSASFAFGQVSEPIPSLTYQDVAPILAAHCSSCHSNAADNGLGGISVDTEAEVISNAAVIIGSLQSGWMPYEQPDWHTTDDGQKLIAWLQSQLPPFAQVRER